ncbi:MAG: hypothetical protein KAW00_06905 [Dehalococcoidia bacterium]|nr:hypothetical protein [Dehalococcoidia bacterium]
MSKKKLAGIIVVCIIAIIVIVAIATSPPTPVEPAEFVVSNLNISPEEVKPGETVTVTVEVRNTGEEKGTHELELIINGVLKQSESVTLDGGETTSISFSVEEGIWGSYDVEVAGLTGTFVVVEPVPAIITLQGTGATATETFALEKGLSIFHMTHDGASNFIIWLYDRDGYSIDLLVNEIGPFDGSTVVGVTGQIFDAAPGIHYIDVEADGNWEVTLEQ